MLRSFYIAGTGMMTQRSKMDVIVNNIANMDTVGYRQDQMVTRSFEDLMLDRLNDTNVSNWRQNTYVGEQNTGTHIDEVIVDFAQGPTEVTDEMTDMAIMGDGFFAVETPAGVRYTRAGDFQVDQNGWLLTQEGYNVLGADGGRLNVGTAGFSVGANGTIFTNDGQQIGRFRIVTFENLDDLRKVGDNNYMPYNNAAPIELQDYTVQQGMLESSNVDSARVVSDMLMTNRVYESSQRMLRMVDESLSKTVNDIGRF